MVWSFAGKQASLLVNSEGSITAMGNASAHFCRPSSSVTDISRRAEKMTLAWEVHHRESEAIGSILSISKTLGKPLRVENKPSFCLISCHEDHVILTSALTTNAFETFLKSLQTFLTSPWAKEYSGQSDFLGLLPDTALLTDPLRPPTMSEFLKEGASYQADEPCSFGFVFFET